MRVLGSCLLLYAYCAFKLLDEQANKLCLKYLFQCLQGGSNFYFTRDGAAFRSEADTECSYHIASFVIVKKARLDGGLG